MGSARDVQTLTLTGFHDEVMQSNYGPVAVKKMKVTFVNGVFSEMELSGHKVGAPGVRVSRLFDKPSQMPAWAIPWTVYGADEIADWITD